MPIDLVIFDCDGVLVDSEQIAIQVDQEVLHNLGWQISIAEIVDRFVGRSNSHFKFEVEKYLDIKLPENWSDQLTEKYRERFAAELRPIAGVSEVLAELPYKYCVASSGSIEKMRFTLGHTGLLPKFDGKLFSAEQVIHGKPAPDLFLLAAKTMGALPQHCVVIEDSPAGLQAARAAGMRSIAYSGGLVPEEKLTALGVPIIRKMTNLIEALSAV